MLLGRKAQGSPSFLEIDQKWEEMSGNLCAIATGVNFGGVND